MPYAREPHVSYRWTAPTLAVLLGGLLLVGCGREATRAPAAPPEVAVVTVAPELVVLTTELPGRVSAFRTAEIRPQVSGVLMKRLYSEGAVVRSGQALYQIDPATYQAALDNAQATLARAEAQLPPLRLRAERVQSLQADRAVSQQDVDDAASALLQAEAEVKVWKAAVAAAQVNLSRCRITAPVSGRIGRSSATEGALVTAYQPLALSTIQQIDSVYVDVTQSTGDVLQLRRRLDSGLLRQGSAEVSLVLEDGLAYSHRGLLRFREVTTDPTTGSVILRAAFPNPDAVLLPGMFVHALIEDGVSEQAILIPQQGVSRTPKGEPIALVIGEGSIVEQRLLTLDRAVGSRWLVTSGLTIGEQVIVEGSQRARAGTTVKAVPFAETAADSARPDPTTPRPATAN